MSLNKMPKPILIIEDSPEDFEVLERAFKKADLDIPLFRCKSGQEALDFLFRDGAFKDYPASPIPALILLDLNMPGTDGYTVLQALKKDDRLKSIPVIVLSTSKSADDVRRSYQSGANSYIQKPEDMQGYVSMAQIIKTYWFGCSILPLQWGNA